MISTRGLYECNASSTQNTQFSVVASALGSPCVMETEISFLVRDGQTLSVVGQVGRTWGFVDIRSLLSDSALQLWCKGSRRYYVNRWQWLGASQTWSEALKLEFHTFLFMFHKVLFLFWFVFQLFKNVKTIASSWIIQKQVVGCIGLIPGLHQLTTKRGNSDRSHKSKLWW